MASLANIRALPGLYGGGFARVVQVDRLVRNSGQEAVRLEKLSNPLEGFSQHLAQFTSSNQAAPQTTARLSGDAVTLLQQVSDPLVRSPDSTYAQQLSEAESRRKEAAAEQRERQRQQEAAIAALKEQLEKGAADFEIPSLNFSEVDDNQVAINSSTAAQAVAAYAATRGASSELSLTA